MKSNKITHTIAFFIIGLFTFVSSQAAGSKDSFYQRSGFTLSLAYEGEP